MMIKLLELILDKIDNELEKIIECTLNLIIEKKSQADSMYKIMMKYPKKKIITSKQKKGIKKNNISQINDKKITLREEIILKVYCFQNNYFSILFDDSENIIPDNKIEIEIKECINLYEFSY